MIQDSSTVEYEFLDKPVHYSPEFLSSLTGNVSCDVCDEHNGVKLTKTKNIFLKDNKLYAILEEELDTKNKGFSTRIRPLEFLEHENFYEITKGELLNVDLTSNPKIYATILENSDYKIKNKGGIMEDSQILNEKNQQIGALKNEVNKQKDRNEQLESQLQELKNKEKESIEKYNEMESKLNNKIQSYEDQLKVYNDKEKETVEKLAKELSQDDEQLFDIYNKMSSEQLLLIKEKNDAHDKYMEEKLGRETGFRGAAGGSSGTNRGGTKPREDEFDFIKLAKENGVKL